MAFRIWTALLLFAELALLLVLAVAILLGSLDQGTGFLWAALAAVAGVSSMAALALPARIGRQGTVHGALVAGAVVFTLPFVWLLSTSFKYPEEVAVYPPKWVPAAPRAARQSPYVSGELFKPVAPPPELDPARWDTLWPRFETMFWERARALLGPERLEGLDEASLRQVLAQALWQGTAPGIPGDTWRELDQTLLDTLAARVDADRVEDAWSAVFRAVAVRRLSVTDLDRREYPVPESERLLETDAKVFGGLRLARRSISLDPVKEAPLLMEYDFSGGPLAGFTVDLPLPVPLDQFLGVTVPLRQDRTWHRVGFVLEAGGLRYESRNPLYLGYYRWQELTFKRSGLDATDERDLGIWPLTKTKPQPAAFNEPGRFRITLTLEQSSPWAAAWYKYTQNYRSAWIVGKNWEDYLFNSVYLVILTVIGQMIGASMVAYAFSRLDWPGRDVLFFLLLATMMLPPQVTMIPVFLIFRTLGWYNTLKPLWVPAFTGAAFFIFLLRQFMKGIPRELEEAARIDGCSYYGTYTRIILPLIKPALAAVGIFTFMGTWNDFMGPLIYLSDQRLYPLALGLFDFRAEHGGDFGVLMAASTIMILPVLALFFFTQRYFIEGVTLTGLKG
jgi:multiple sugar transport system permease protein